MRTSIIAEVILITVASIGCSQTSEERTGSDLRETARNSAAMTAGDEGGAATLAESAFGESEAPSAFAPFVDSEDSSIALAPLGTPETGELDMAAFGQALQVEKPDLDIASALAAADADPGGRAISEETEILLGRERGTFIFRDLRKYSAQADGGETTTDGLEARTKVLLQTLDPETAQEQVYETRKIGAAGVTREGVDLGVRRVGYKVFVHRTLGGIRVAGDRLVFTFDLTGGLKKVLGRWRSLDPSRSQFTARSAQSSGDVVAAALEALSANGVHSFDVERIVVSTEYEISGNVATLKGAVTVYRNGPYPTPSVIRFDI